MKSWLKSRTVWFATGFEILGLTLAFSAGVAELLPEAYAVPILGVVIFIQGVQQKILRFLTKLGITVNKDKVTVE
jgi:hypothetical protein